MSKKRIQELHELTARISKLDISKLSESQLAERNTLINNIREELTKIKEVSDETLKNYLTKVDADSQKHKSDPTKRSPEKANKSVAGFARAFNKLDARKEQSVTEGQTPEQEIERLKLRQNAEHGGVSLKRQAETQARIRELEKQIKDKEGVAESDLAQQMLAFAKSRGMNARVAGTPDEERARTQQMMAQRAKERQEQEHQAAQADAANLPELKAKYEEMKKFYQSLGGSNWQYADREQNLTDAERKARSMEPELQRLAAQISRAEKSQGVAEGSLNEGQYEMMMRNGQVKKFIAKDDADAKRIAAGYGAKSVIKLKGGVPAGKVAEQGVAEGVEDNPVVNAITRRIMMQRVDLLSKYGPEKVGAAIDDVADYVGDFISDNDEIGSSDVSGWVRQVERVLSDSTGITTEAYDRLKKVFDFSDFKG